MSGNWCLYLAMSGNGREKTSLIISAVVITAQLVCAKVQPTITVCAMVLTVRMETGQWLWVEGCIRRSGDGWRKVRLVAQSAPFVETVAAVRKCSQVCANVHSSM